MTKKDKFYQSMFAEMIESTDAQTRKLNRSIEGGLCMDIRAAIFDLDGTLLNSSFVWAGLGKAYLSTLGIIPKDDIDARCRTLSLEQSARLLRKEYAIPLTENEIITQITALTERFYRYEIPLKPGVGRLLEALHGRRVKMCVATANTEELTAAALARTDILKYFEGIFTCGEYGAKDSPNIYLASAKALGEPPQRVIVFEDSLHALTAASSAGFVTAAVKDESEPSQNLLELGADYYITDFDGFVDSRLC